MALVSPWNLAFWVGAVGQQAVRDAGAGASLVLAGGVVAGALAWCAVLSTASRFGARVPGPAWEAVLRTVAAAFLLALGARTAVLLLPA
jgi:threonine/homoserine/homoserine lactone efflux protein